MPGEPERLEDMGMRLGALPDEPSTARGPQGPGAAARTRAAGSPGTADPQRHWFADMTAEGIWRFEIDPPVPADLEEGQLISTILERARVAECNAACAQQHGYASPHDMLGLRLVDVTSGPRDQIREAVAQFVRAGFHLTDLETVDQGAASGPRVVLNHVIGTLTEGHLVGGWGTQRDVTEQKRAEEALRASEERLRFLIENVSDVVLMVDAAGIIQFESPSVERVLGHRPEERVGLDARASVHPDDLPLACEALAAALREPGAMSPIIDVRIRHRDGSWRSMQAVGKGVVDPSGRHSILLSLRDVTEHRRMEETLRESQRAMATLLSNLPGMAYRCRNEGKRTMEFVSQGCLALTGYQPEELVLNRRIAYNGIVHPADQDLSTQEIRVALAAREPFEIVYRIVTADGATKCVREVGRGVYLDDGTLVALEGFIADITERRHAEESLRESEETLRVFINAIPEPAFLLDSDFRVLAINEAMARSLGATAEDLVGGPAFDLLPPTLAGPRRARVEQALRTGRPLQWEDERNGRSFLNHVYPVPDATGNPARVAVFAFDLTERKRADEQLVRLAAAVEQSAEDIVLTDVDGNITYVNSAFERTTGYSRAEALNRSPRFLDSGYHDEEFYRAIWAIIGTGRAWKGRFSNRTKDGRVILQDASISPIREPSGRIVGYVSARRDVTQQVEREQHAARAEKLEAIGTLAGGIAHDFNNILSAIVGYTQMAQMKCSRGSAIHQDLEAVLQGSRRAAELVRQILTFSRQERGEEKPVQASPLVKEATKFLRASIPTTIEIRGDFRSDSVVLADPTEIHRIVVNLCTNAALAMREKGGVLEVGLADVDLDAALVARHPGLEPGRYLRLRVRDTGCGMSREVMARIFEPFFTTRGEGEGSGMGLPVVHGIVKRCRGAIAVESEPGKGTTFDVLLPVVQREAPVTAAAPEPPHGGTERVLFVDDEPLVAGLAVALLGRLGYRVRTFTDSRQALAAFEAEPDAFDLVITDMTMPGVTGEALARRVKRLRPDLPVILCTGYSETMNAEKARSLGIDEFAMKPVAVDDLTKIVRRVLDRR